MVINSSVSFNVNRKKKTSSYHFNDQNLAAGARV